MSHSNTVFSNLLALIPRHIFQKLEHRHEVGRSTRKFGFKEQFTLLAFIQLSARRSLRDGLRCLAAIPTRLYHFGLCKVALSTVSEANNHRPTEFFKDLFNEMYNLCSSHSTRHKFRFKSKLYSLDATTISLCLSLFPWAKHRKNKGGIKLNTALDHSGYIPAFVCITNASTHESKTAKSLAFPEKSILVFDKGYCNYTWFQELSAKNIFFVTRLKKNARYKVIERRAVNKKSGVTSDQIIEIKIGKQVLRLRRVGYKDEKGNHYKYLTNNLLFSAKTIADIYKERWQIELFFKEIKQNLKIKKFVGNSENAVMIQIYSALTTYLLLAYQKFLSKTKLSVQQLLEIVTLNLLTNKHVEELLNPQSERQRIKHNIYEYSMLDIGA